MAGVSEYSTTAASNTHVNNIDIRGTANVQNHDNGMRQIMADLASARIDGQMASMPYSTKSAGYTLATTDRGRLIDCTAALEIELLAAATAGAAFFFIVKANGGAVTLDPNGVEEINGSSTSATVADGTSAIVCCNGTAWFTSVVGQGDVTLTGTQTLTNKTLTSPVMTTPTLGVASATSLTTTGNIELGHASDTTLSRSAAGVIAVEGVPLYSGIPITDKSEAYTLVLADRQTAIRHPAADNNARTYTIPANASVAYAVGTVLSFINEINTVTIAITSDTLVLADDGSTGSRTLAANGIATAIKVASTRWYISGVGLT